MSQALPPLNPIPDDIEDHIARLLQAPGNPATGQWLLELIKSSGHMSTADDMRWRVLCTVWLAFEYDVEQAWPYLMWLNMNEPAISTHLSEILIEAIDNFDAHVKMANWMATTTDERLSKFFKDFHAIPAQRNMRPLVGKLFANPTRPELEPWLAHFCQGTLFNEGVSMRPWRLLAAAWYAAGFNPTEGLAYLKKLTNGADTLSPADNKLLMEAAGEANALTPMIQLIANCSTPAVKEMLKDFGHPDLPAVVETVLAAPPDYSHLSDSAEQARLDAEAFKRHLACLEQAGLPPKKSKILDLACGPFVPHTLLLNSAGYKTLGVDLHIPPGYLPLSGIKQWFKRRKHAKAWKQATAAYYQALARHAGTPLKWRRVNIKLADLTRLELAGSTFDAVICAGYLQHAPDVDALLAQAARVLKPGGLLLADIRPYAGLHGAFQDDPNNPWQHLLEDGPPASVSVNKWRQAQYRAALEKYFSLEQWLPQVDAQAQVLLTPKLKARLSDYSPEELTCQQIVVIAKK